MYQYLIKNITIADGTGRNAEVADIAISGERIAAIGHLGDIATTIVDGSYLVATPGIIDASATIDKDWTLFTDPGQEKLLRRGITTVIGGSHLISAAPISNARTIANIATYSASGLINVDWQSVGEFLTQAEKKSFGVNFTTLLGGITLFMNAPEKETPSAKQTILATLIYQGLGDGARGLAFSLSQTKRVRFTTEEIVSFAQIAQENDVPVILHLADYGENILSAVNTAVYVARKSGARILIDNFFIAREHEHLLQRVLDLVDRARKDGVEVMIELLPWDHVEVTLLEILPFWLKETTEIELLQQIEIASGKKEFVENLKNKITSPENIIITSLERSSGLNGLTLTRATEILHLSLEETVVEILHSSHLRAKVQIPGLSPIALRVAAYSESTILTGQNGLGSFHSTDSLPEPQTPFVLAERSRGMLRYEDLAQKLAANVADFFKVKNRGTLEKGNFADIVLLDPTQSGERVVHSVFVNGKGAILEGVYQQTTSGKILR